MIFRIDYFIKFEATLDFKFFKELVVICLEYFNYTISKYINDICIYKKIKILSFFSS